MFWYIVICILMLYPFYVVRAGALSDKKTQGLALGISCFVLWIFMAFRDISVGVDTKYYAHVFSQFKDIPLLNTFTAETFATSSETWSMDFEYGYRLYNKLLSYISNAPQMIIICNSTLILVLLFFLIRKCSPDFMLSIWLYITLGLFQTEMNVSRNAIAILIAYLGFQYLNQKRFWPFFITCLSAMLFHKAAVLYIPVYWLVYNIRWTQKKMAMTVFASAGVGIVFPYIAPYLSSFLPYSITKYFQSNFSKMESMVVGVFYLALFVMIYILMNRKEQERVFEKCRLGTTLFTLTISCYALNFGIGYAARIAALFGPYMILYLPQMIQQIESEEKKKVITLLLVAGCGCQYILRLCINNIGGTMPYVFFW